MSVKYREARSGKVEVGLRSSWADGKGSHVKDHVKSAYDATVIYCPDSGGCYYVRNEEIAGKTIVLRTVPARNNQLTGVRDLEKIKIRDLRRIFLAVAFVAT